MKKEKKNFIEIFKNLSRKIKLAILLSLSCLIVAILCIVIFAPSGHTSVSVKTSLKEFLSASEMFTAEYTYNSIVKVPIDTKKPLDDDNIKYYVSYKGTVNSGFDFDDIQVIDQNGNITVIIPKIEIMLVNVNTDLEYIFTKQKYDTEHTYAEALNAAKTDLENKAKANDTLFRTAKQSAIDTITALTKPFEKALEEGAKITITYIDDYTNGGQK